MISIRINGVNLTFEFAFFAVAALIFACGKSDIYAFAAACLVHELGHIIAVHAFGGRVGEVTFSSTGIRMRTGKSVMLPAICDIVILVAGSFCNLLSFVLVRTGKFAEFSLILGIFNLMPFSGLDGGCIVLTIGDIFCQSRTAVILLKIAAVIITAAMIGYSIYFNTINWFQIIMLYYCLAELVT